jgi:hypothetical protein
MPDMNNSTRPSARPIGPAAAASCTVRPWSPFRRPEMTSCAGSSGGARLMQLQLLATATAINLKRLIATRDTTRRDQAGDPATRATAIT